MKKVLVTGWSGFLGLRTTRFLLSGGYSVVGLSRTKSKPGQDILQDSNFSLVQASVGDWPAFEKIPDVEAVIHIAGNVSVKASAEDPRMDFESNVQGTFNVLEFCRERNLPLVLASTAKIHPIKDMVSRSVYGTSKLAADFYAQEYYLTFGLPVVINRFVTFYGPEQYSFGQPDRSWVNWFLEANLRSLPIQIMGEGGQVRDPLFIDDAARLLVAELEEPKMYGQIYDVGAGQDWSTTPRDIIKAIEETTGKKFARVKKIPARADIKKSFVADISELKPFWQPETSFRDGLKMTYNWMKEAILK